MKPTTGKTEEVLNKLLRINNDRVDYYQKASKKTDELNLKTALNNMAVESEKNVSALAREITKSGNEPFESGLTSRSTFYHLRMKMKSLFTGSGSQAILDSCAPGENTIQTAYRVAISSNDLTMQARQLVRNQQAALKALYDILITVKHTPVLVPIIF